MIRNTLLAVAAFLALASPAAAQSVTSAPTPSENLSRLQERVYELEDLLRQSNGEAERLAIELRRAKAENARLERLLNDATGAAAAPAEAASPGSGQLGTLPAAQAAIDPGQQLREAMRFLQLGRYPEAEAALAAFVAANPQSPDTPEARYFIGRTQVAQRRYADAADTFVKFVTDYPSASRAPDAWASLGVSLRGMGKTAEACGVFRDLTVKYPRAGVPARNLAAAEARAANCR